MNSSSIQVSQSAGTAWFFVEGKGSFQNAGLLKEACQKIVDGGLRRIVLHLGGCTGMDSTFLGTIAGLSLRMRGLQGAVVLTRVKGRNLELIENMGLNRLVTVDDNLPSPADPVVPVPMPANEPDKKETSKTMLQAHETLVAIDQQNQAKFQDVIEFLRKEVRGTGSG